MKEGKIKIGPGGPPGSIQFERVGGPQQPQQAKER